MSLTEVTLRITAGEAVIAFTTQKVCRWDAIDGQSSFVWKFYFYQEVFPLQRRLVVTRDWDRVGVFAYIQRHFTPL